MVPYIDDSRVRGWKKPPRNRHVCRVSYHPRLRSYLSSFRLELPHKQFHGLQDHETSLAECDRKFLELVYCGSESCEQSPSDQRSPCGCYHPPWVAEIDNDSIRLFFLESLCRVFVVKSYQRAKSCLVDVRLGSSQELWPHLVGEHLAIRRYASSESGCQCAASSPDLQHSIPVSY